MAFKDRAAVPLKAATQTVGKMAHTVDDAMDYAGTVRKSASSVTDQGLGQVLKFMDNAFGQESWIPWHIRLFFKIKSLKGIVADEWLFFTRFDTLDKKTAPNLSSKYSEELDLWRSRFDDLKNATYEQVYRVFQIVSLIVLLPIALAVGGSVGSVYAFGLAWWLGILIFCGSYLAALIITLAGTVTVTRYRGYRKLVEYADLLLVNSLLRLLLAMIEGEEHSLADIVKKKRRIIEGIEESAKWLRHTASLARCKDRALDRWYCGKIDEVIKTLRDLRYQVMRSATGYSEEVFSKVFDDYFDAALRHDYGKLLTEGDLQPIRFRQRAKGFASTGTTGALVVAFISLLGIEFGQSKDSLLPPEVLSMVGSAAFLSLAYWASGGSRALSDIPSGTKAFDSLLSSLRK